MYYVQYYVYVEVASRASIELQIVLLCFASAMINRPTERQTDQRQPELQPGPESRDPKQEHHRAALLGGKGKRRTNERTFKLAASKHSAAITANFFFP